MTGHHLILGELVDFLTGKTIEDSHDERLRQAVAKYLVHQKGYDKTDIRAGEKIHVYCGENRALVPLDFRISLHGKTAMIVKYGPGSILTRHKPALALSRLVAPYQVPVVVVTNGRAVDVISGENGRHSGDGFGAIPSKQRLLTIASRENWSQLPEKQIEMASRILYAYEIDGACPCDDTICRL
jgi:hypothetical protein